MSGLPNYPLCFEPIFKERIWGGRRLETVLGKRLPPEQRIGESWEISDHGESCGIVANGPLRGVSLRELMSQSTEQLLGSAVTAHVAHLGPAPLRFPLLVKWIDAHEKLSVQVHPRDGHPQLPPGEQGKTECWYVADAEPGAKIYLGLRRGIDRAALLHELHRGTVDRCLNIFPAQVGDFFFVPAGMPHALGAGALLAEVQQTSDTTFRLFDWNRVDPATGRPRELQIDAALDSIDFGLPTRGPGAKKGTGPFCRNGPEGASHKMDLSPFSPTPPETMLLGPNDCPYFMLARRSVTAAVKLGDPDRFHILVCLAGSGEISGGGETVQLKRGSCVLLPGGGPFVCKPRPQLELLDAWVP